MAMARAAVDVEDLLVRVKTGAEADLAAAAREVAALAANGRLGEDDDEDGLLVAALLARLAAAAATADARVSVMAALRRLAGCVAGESKVTSLIHARQAPVHALPFPSYYPC
jgi:vacuolar protein 8